MFCVKLQDAIPYHEFYEGINVEDHMTTFLSTWNMSYLPNYLNVVDTNLSKRMEFGLSLDGQVVIWLNQLPNLSLSHFDVICSTFRYMLNKNLSFKTRTYTFTLHINFPMNTYKVPHLILVIIVTRLLENKLKAILKFAINNLCGLNGMYRQHHGHQYGTNLEPTP